MPLREAGMIPAEQHRPPLYASARVSPSGRPSKIDDGTARTHDRVQCERLVTGWVVSWPGAARCPSAATGDGPDFNATDCTCVVVGGLTFEHALSLIRERVDVLDRVRTALGGGW